MRDRGRKIFFVCRRGDASSAQPAMNSRRASIHSFSLMPNLHSCKHAFKPEGNVLFEDADCRPRRASAAISESETAACNVSCTTRFYALFAQLFYDGAHSTGNAAKRNHNAIGVVRQVIETIAIIASECRPNAVSVSRMTSLASSIARAAGT